MKFIIFVTSLILSLNILASSPQNNETRRFVDHETNQVVPGLNHLFEPLIAFYGEKFPQIIRIKYHNGRFSGYEHPNIIWLGNFSRKPDDRTERFYEVVKHELSHLGNMHLTNELSKENRFRFFDEGFAMLFEFSDKKQWHYQKSIQVGKEYYKHGKVSLALAEDWKNYFGDPSTGKVDKNVYFVGSTFVYFLIESYGIEKFRKFLLAIGNTQNLDLALLNTYELSREKTESYWLDYILTN